MTVVGCEDKVARVVPAIRGRWVGVKPFKALPLGANWGRIVMASFFKDSYDVSCTLSCVITIRIRNILYTHLTNLARFAVNVNILQVVTVDHRGQANVFDASILVSLISYKSYLVCRPYIWQFGLNSNW